MLVYKQRAQKETHSTPFLPAPPGGGDGCPSLFTLMGVHTLHAFPMPSPTNIRFLPSAHSNSFFPRHKKQKQRSLPLAEENYSQTSNKRWCFPGVTPLRSSTNSSTRHQVPPPATHASALRTGLEMLVGGSCPGPPATLSPWIRSTAWTAKKNGNRWVQSGHGPTRQADGFYF